MILKEADPDSLIRSTDPRGSESVPNVTDLEQWFSIEISESAYCCLAIIRFSKKIRTVQLANEK
jgi:hypothetical protein